MLNHLSVDSTLEESRSRAWIASGRRLARKTYDACIICRRRGAEFSGQHGPVPNVTLAALPENALKGGGHYDVTKYGLRPIAAEDFVFPGFPGEEEGLDRLGRMEWTTTVNQRRQCH